MAGGNNSTAHSGLVKAVMDYLHISGAWVFKVQGGLGQRAGVVDILAVLQGRAIGVECKTGRAVLSPSQQIEMAAMRKAGAIVVECRDLNDLEDALVGEGLTTPKLHRKKA
jgi:hypothetical protein